MGTKGLEVGEISSLSSPCQVVQAESAKHQPLEAHRQKPGFLSSGIFLSILLRHLSLHFCMCMHLSECPGHMCCVHIHTCIRIYGERIMGRGAAVSFVLSHRFAGIWSGRSIPWGRGSCSNSEESPGPTVYTAREEGLGGAQTPSAMQTPTQSSPLHNWLMHVKKPLKGPWESWLRTHTCSAVSKQSSLGLEGGGGERMGKGNAGTEKKKHNGGRGEPTRCQGFLLNLGKIKIHSKI